MCPKISINLFKVIWKEINIVTNKLCSTYKLFITIHKSRLNLFEAKPIRIGIDPINVTANNDLVDNYFENAKDMLDTDTDDNYAHVNADDKEDNALCKNTLSLAQ